MMPGVDGPELCRRVRDELGDRYIYIVLITGLGHPEQVLEGMSAGADDYLIKPVDPFAVQTRLVAAERVTVLAPPSDPTSGPSSNRPTSNCSNARSPTH